MNLITNVNFILAFILFLYGDPNLPRKVVNDVVNFFHEFIKTIFISSLKEDIMMLL